MTLHSLFLSPSKRPAVPLGDKMVWRGPDKVEKESGKLLRLQRLYKALPSASEREDRSLCLGLLEKVWSDAQNAHKEAVDSSVVRGDIYKGLGQLGGRISGVYKSELEAAPDREIGDCIRRFSKDAAAMGNSPMKKSVRGNKGPTFLVNYNSPNGMRAYVLKWTNMNEIACGRIYSAFAECFTDEDVCCGFSVPPSSRVDLEDGIHETMLGEINPIRPAAAKRLQQNFLKLVETYDSEIEPSSSQVMIAEKIKGQNLLEFSFTKYIRLSPQQREKFFERLGRIAMLDLLMGNLDRLIQVDFNKGEYFIDDALEVNLGNVMVVMDKDFHLFAIDNGIEQNLIDSGEHIEKYNKFLAGLLAREDFCDVLTRNIIKCFYNALRSQVDEVHHVDDEKMSGPEDGQRRRAQEQIRGLLKEHIEQDLEKIAPRAIHTGLAKMSSWLNKEIFQKAWVDSPQSERLHKYLAAANPMLLEALQSRIAVFTKTMGGK